MILATRSTQPVSLRRAKGKARVAPVRTYMHAKAVSLDL